MKRITLLARVYGQYRNRLLQTLKSDIQHMIQELDVQLKRFDIDKKGHIILDITGSDYEFFRNVLQQEFGITPEIHEILPGTQHIGQLVDVGKVGYGIYVDIGNTAKTSFDALIPLHRLREQTEMDKQSLRQIAKNQVLVDNLPAEVRIISIDVAAKKIEAELSSSFIERLNNWKADDHERLLVFGANQGMIENALRLTKHSDDIYSFEKIGFFEYVLVCKRSTRASGILSAIGPKLKGVPMHLFIPKEIEGNPNDAT
ncbi:MAG: DUF2110 family protein [Candidatus Thorarchaeota archaeon]